MTGDEQVAAWMAARVRGEGVLFQVEAAEEIEQRFGSAYVYRNPKGALAISRAVLSAFGRLTAGDVIWVLGRRYWRRREPEDAPGRAQGRPAN